MKLVFLMNLPLYLLVLQILAREKAMIEKIEIQKIENMALILIDKKVIQKPTHIITKIYLTIFMKKKLPILILYK